MRQTHIDKVDRKIIELLQENGRRTNADIARSIKKSESTVKSRVDRLIHNGILKVLAVLNPKSLGYLTDVTILIKVQPGKYKEIGEKLLNLNEVIYLSYVGGGVDIIIEVILKKPEDLYEFISKTFKAIPEINSTESAFIMRTERINYEWKLFDISANGADSNIQPAKKRNIKSKKRKEIQANDIYKDLSKSVELDETDRIIITLLQENGRRTNADIARSIKMSESTVKNRLDRLIDQGFLNIQAILNPNSVGYHVDVLIGIKVQPGQLYQVGERLLNLYKVIYLSYHSGRFDILIEVLFQNTEEFFLFIAETLGKIPGIQSNERFHVLRTERINYEWKLP